MALHAFIDGAQTDHEVLVLAGYLSDADSWSNFRQEWKAALDGPPRWPKLSSKMAKRKLRLDPEFRRRYAEHYEIILKNVKASLCVAIPLRDFNKVCDEYEVDRVNRNPYWMAWNSLISLYSGHCKKVGLQEPVSFVFDQQSEQRYIEEAWESFYSGIPRWLKSYVGKDISFKKDSRCLPLQAADLIAYWKREEFLELNDLKIGPMVPWKNSAPPHRELYGILRENGIRKIVFRNFGTKYSIKSVKHFDRYPGFWFPLAEDWRS